MPKKNGFQKKYEFQKKKEFILLGTFLPVLFFLYKKESGKTNFAGTFVFV